MAWHVEFNEHFGVACLTFEGDSSYDDVMKSSQAVIDTMVATNTRKILTDFTGAGHVAVTSVDIAQLPNRYKEQGLAGAFYEALVAPRGSPMHEPSLFYETVCTNRGNMVRVFETRDDALRWLSK